MTLTTEIIPDSFGELFHNIRPETGRGAPAAPAVQRLGKNIGARISGIRVSGDLSVDEVEFIRTALATYKVVVFEGQHHVDDETQYAFAQRLGTPTLAHPTVHSTGRDRLVIEGAANAWHTDVTFVDRVPKASILRPKILPPYGGGTVWANTVAAYEALPEPLRVLAENLRAVHSNDYDYAAQGQRSTDTNFGSREEFVRIPFETEHPVVHVRPETGERSLLLGQFVKKFTGLRAYESTELYRIFQERITKPDNTFRWNWKHGDLAIWDNQATQHYGISDFGAHRRELHRVTLAGAIPVGVDGRPSTVLSGDASEYSAIDTAPPLRDYRGDSSVLTE